MYLDRLTLILETVGKMEEATVSEICAEAELPKASVYRLVKDLVGVGLLEPLGRGSFTVGSRLKRIAHSNQSDRALIETVAPILKRAATDHGAAFFLSRLRDNAVEIIDVQTPGTGVSYLHPGLGKRPLHACSCSKAIAAFLPDPVLASHLEGRLRAYTEFTLTDPRDLAADFERVRERGFAECVEEIERGICSVAAPLAASGPGAEMAVGATGSVRVFTANFRADLGSKIVQIAGEISDHLGLRETEEMDMAV